MDTRLLEDALARLFIDEGQRLVFWHDPDGEFVDFMNRLPFLTFGDTTVHILRLDQVGGLEAKLRLEHDDPNGKFLLYAPTEEPAYEDDWLLDIRLYSRSFRADRASILLDELGLVQHHLRDHLAARRTFFDHKDRLRKLKALVTPTDSADDLDRKMLSVVVKADQPELFAILRTLYHACTAAGHDSIDLQTPPPCWHQIEQFDLAEPFWRFVETAFGYTEASPTLRNLLIRLLVTDYAHGLRGELPPALAHLRLPRSGRQNAVVCLAQWRDSTSTGSSYDLLSAEVARIVKITDHIHGLEAEALLDSMTFLDVEQAIVRDLRDQVLSTADTIDVEAVRAIATRRQDGHWASLQASASQTVPRQALHAIYDAIVAAAEFFHLRNQHRHGFAFDSPRAMYQAYTAELYRFDQLYRHFCEAADVADNQSWDILKHLREQVEAVYATWYVPTQALAWGAFVDPAGATDLLGHWQLDGVPNQYAFYRRHVQTRLDEADNRKVFVIISDAFRYEAAHELTQMLNSTYRLEAVRTAMTEIADTVRYIVNTLNGNYVLITADHGFLFTETAPGAPDRSPLGERPAGTRADPRRQSQNHHGSAPLHPAADRASQPSCLAGDAQGRRLRRRRAGHQHRDRHLRQLLWQSGRPAETGAAGLTGPAVRQENPVPPGAT